MSIPHLFRCPISLDLFTDPVTLCTGQTYDRPCIEKWISSGNFTCPVTMLRLHDISMVPNRTLSHLIRQWLDQTARVASDHEDDEYLVSLKQTLESHEPIWEQKVKALKQVKALSLELPGRENEGLIKLGFFSLLLELAFGSNNTQQRLEFVELALNTAIKLMPFSDVGCLNILTEEQKMACLLSFLENGTPLIKISLCHLLEAILLSQSSSSQQLKELCSLIINSGEIPRLIVNLIQDYHDDYDSDEFDEEENAELSEAGVKAMQALCLNCANSNHNQSKKVLEKLIQVGAVSCLVRYIMKALERGPRAEAVAALEILLEVEGGKEALIKEKNGVKSVVKMVFRVSDHKGSENAVNCLMGLCSEFVEAREEAVKNGVLTQLLLLLQSQCNGKAKTRARMMLKLLRSLWVKDPIGRTRKHVAALGN